MKLVTSETNFPLFLHYILRFSSEHDNAEDNLFPLPRIDMPKDVPLRPLAT
jgi:hypothetical protein